MNAISKTEAVETLNRTEIEPKLWEQEVRDNFHDRCSNCGNDDHLKVSMVVPEEAGGKRIITNSRLLCRACELASVSANSNKGEEARRALNFWVSRKLYDSIQKGLDTRAGFGSMGSLVRYLMEMYSTDLNRFEDVAQYQDSGTDVKINVWVNSDKYDTFKKLVDSEGLTVTECLKSLILFYHGEAQPLIHKRN